MPDDQAPAEEQQDTPTPQDDAAPETDTQAESTDTPSVDYEKRYSDLRPEYDRTTQRLSQYEEFVGNLKDPETRAEALLALGLQIEEDEPDTPEYDPDDYDQRFERTEQQLEQIDQFLSQQAQAQQEQAFLAKQEDFVVDTLTELDPDESFSDDYIDLLVEAAPENDDGFPDVKAAHERFQREFEAQRKGWVESKNAPRPGSGASPSHQPNLDDQEERRQYIAQRMAENG